MNCYPVDGIRYLPDSIYRILDAVYRVTNNLPDNLLFYFYLSTIYNTIAVMEQIICLSRGVYQGRSEDVGYAVDGMRSGRW